VLRVLVPVSILAVILLAVSTVGFIEYSARPSFCDNCHIMQPYYDSWATSSHREVACIQCHYAPGIRAEAMGKLQAANQVVKYVTGAYGMKPWAEVEDAACLRSGCHPSAGRSLVDTRG
jgi:nitrate/TMAO reductase-like tetraheme cytochrome c subunit